MKHNPRIRSSYCSFFWFCFFTVQDER